MGKIRNFMDDDRPVMMQYYDVLEQELNQMDEIKAMEDLIKQDPDFYDPYVILSDHYHDIGMDQKATTILEEGYKRAIARITDKKGNWPDSIEWGWLENRHIIRVLVNKGIHLWENNEPQPALDLFRKLLSTNPGDNAGVRFYILAILLKMPYANYMAQFENDEYMNPAVFDWFDAQSKKFSGEFKVLEELE